MAGKKGLEFIHVELKRDTWLSPEATVRTPDDAVDVIHDMLRDMDREMLVCINMAASGRVINASICSVGTMDMALVSPPEILRGALLSGARSLIMLHNHPSGQISPSTSLQSPNGAEQSSAFKRIGGGLVMILAPQLISLFIS